VSNVIFGEMVDLLKNAPDSFYETKKLLKALECNYNKIDAC